MKLSGHLIVTLLLLVPPLAHTQSLEGRTYGGMADYLIFGAQRVRVMSYDFQKRIYLPDAECPYSLTEMEGIPILDLGQPISERWLFLHSQQFAIAFRNDNSGFFRGDLGVALGFNNVRRANAYEATSALVEGTKTYGASNLGLIRTDNPWVEGAKGPGIGEKLTLTLQTWKGPTGQVGGMGALVIVNGYISYGDPSLYLKNNRVRGTRISAADRTFAFDSELQDTPNPQIVLLPHPTSKVTIEITSVYPGTIWDDTCLSLVWALEAEQAAKLPRSKG
jgi:hypothetical protein